jgi:hypothetical protein
MRYTQNTLYPEISVPETLYTQTILNVSVGDQISTTEVIRCDTARTLCTLNPEPSLTADPPPHKLKTCHTLNSIDTGVEILSYPVRHYTRHALYPKISIPAIRDP